MNESFYKKTGLVTAMLARALLTSHVGDRCPTISHCTDSFSVSRGTVQDAFATLESSGCISTVSHGQKGTVIESIDKSLLYKYTGLDALTATMPVPLTNCLSGLATAICRCMASSPIPFTFAFIEGAGKRVNALLRMNYDFVVVSSMTAKTCLAQHSELEIAIALNNCIYSPEYVLCINKPHSTGLEDGMTVGYDPNCTDQVTLIENLIKGKQINLKAIPYTACRATLLNYEVDAIVYRKEVWLEECSSVQIFPLIDSLHTQREMNTPVLLVNKNNYGIGSILRHMLDLEELHRFQQLVLDEQMRPQYF